MVACFSRCSSRRVQHGRQGGSSRLERRHNSHSSSSSSNHVPICSRRVGLDLCLLPAHHACMSAIASALLAAAARLSLHARMWGGSLFDRHLLLADSSNAMHLRNGLLYGHQNHVGAL